MLAKMIGAFKEFPEAADPLPYRYDWPGMAGA